MVKQNSLEIPIGNENVSNQTKYLIFRLWKLEVRVSPVWPDWAIYCTLGNFSKPVATFILPKFTTFFDNFRKVLKIFNFPSEIILGNFYRDISQLFTGQSEKIAPNLFFQRQLGPVEDRFDPVGVEACFRDVFESLHDRRLDQVDVVHCDAL